MAAQFRFALQAVLDARQRVEDEKTRDLAARRRAVETADAELGRIVRARERCMNELAASAQTAAVPDLRVRDAHLRRLGEAFAERSLARGELFAAWESARDAFVAARRARRTLERLKERRRRAFEAEEARREELELDESNERLRRRRAGSAAS
jgi:flagellar export protein FliJ